VPPTPWSTVFTSTKQPPPKTEPLFGIAKTAAVTVDAKIQTAKRASVIAGVSFCTAQSASDDDDGTF
jgi:hypothetical protein